MKKSKTKSILACAVLASVLSVGAMAEAANFTYKVDGGTEQTWDGSYNLKLNNIGGGTKLEVWEATPKQVSSYDIWGSGHNDTNDHGNYSGKTVIFYSGQVRFVYGGAARYGNANENTVIIYDGVTVDVPPGIYGGDVDSSVYGGNSYQGSTSKNKVIFNGGSAKYVYGGYNDTGTGDSTDNTVTINGGTIYLGYVRGGRGGGIVSGNQVIINGGTIKENVGVYGGSGDGKVRGNQVIINGSTIQNGVYVYGAEGSGEVSGNKVIINGGTVNGTVYASYSKGSGVLNSNTIVVSGGNLSNAEVYGYGYKNSPSSHSNNTLQIEIPTTIKKIGNFDNISFVLPTITGDKTMLRLTDPFSLNDSAVSVYLGENANSALNTNAITLADNVSGNFEVTYYDKNNNATGYKEKFNLASAGGLKIGDGAEMHVVKNLTTDAGEILGKQNMLYVDDGVTLALAGGTLRKNLTGSGGITEFNNVVGVADGVILGTSNNIVNGTLDVLGHITASNIHFKDGSTLKVDGNQISGTAAITGITSATLASDVKIYVSGAVKNTPYKILAGSGIIVSGWQTDAGAGDLPGGLYGVVMDPNFRAAYGLIVDMNNTEANSNGFTVQFRVDPKAMSNVDIGNILSNASPNSALYKYVDTLSQAQSDSATQATIINTMTNMNSLANVQQGTQAIMGMSTGALQTNIGTGSRPMSGGSGQGSGVRKVSANAKDRAAIKVVEQGKRDEVMPVTVGKETLKYDKTVWANYIHSKKTIDGLKSGHLTQNSTIQYNGVTVGADLWSNAKGFGGLALTAATGKTNSSQNGAGVKNDTDYHGISLYQRYDYKDVALLFDLSYTHAKNDVTMSAAGTADVTAKPKSDAYSAGVKVEYPVKVGHSSQLTPYAGLRYTHVHTGKYENSLGISNDIKDQNLVSMPLGVQLKTEYATQKDWRYGHIFEGGYVWNVGNRQSEQRLGYQGVYDSIDFDVTDRGEYFLKTAFTAKHKDTDFELGYRYTRGDNTKDNKWNFNVTYNFGNATGLPYKSVLLGKIDLLESANKELRAENVELKKELAAKDAEIARLKKLLRMRN